MAIGYEWTDEKLAACWAAFHAERSRQFGESPTPSAPKVLYEGEVLIYDDAHFSDVHPSVSLLGIDFQYIGQRVHIVVTAVEE